MPAFWSDRMGKGSIRFRATKRRRGSGSSQGGRPRSFGRSEALDGRNDPGKPLGLRRRLEAAGITVADDATSRQIADLAEATGLRTVSADHPLDLLMARGFLVSQAETAALLEKSQADQIAELARVRYEAGQRYQALVWRLFGTGTAKAQDNGYRTPLNADDFAEAIRRGKRDARLLLASPGELQARKDEWLVDAESDLAGMERALNRCGRYVQTVVRAAVLFVAMPRVGELNYLRQGLDALAST